MVSDEQKPPELPSAWMRALAGAKGVVGQFSSEGRPFLSPQFKVHDWIIAIEHQRGFRSVVLRPIDSSVRLSELPEDWMDTTPSERRKGPWWYRRKIEPRQLSSLIDQIKMLRFEVEDLPTAIGDIEKFDRGHPNLPKTERESLIKSRLGQGFYREQLIMIWKGCAISGVRNPELLRASHAKPWRECTNKERLDPYNGLLLLPHLDHLFDRGLIGFDSEGRIRISPHLSSMNRKLLRIDNSLKLRRIFRENVPYLQYHMERVFREV